MNIIEKKNDDSFFYILAFIIFFVFLGVTVGGEDGLLKLLKLKNTRDELIIKNKLLLMENLTLFQEQKSLYDTKTIEHAARSSLGLVYPDEIVYIIKNHPDKY